MANGESVLVDTSVWVALFQGLSQERLERLRREGQAIAVSILVLAELRSLSTQGRVQEGAVGDVQEVARVESLLAADALEGGRIHGLMRRKAKTKASLVDALILATARRIGATLLTLDQDLAGEPDVEVIA